jgi:hypothetical protein
MVTEHASVNERVGLQVRLRNEALLRRGPDECPDQRSLSYHHRTLMDKVFHQNVIKQISMTADFPVFTFWK